MHLVRTIADRLIGLSAFIGAMGLAVEVCVIFTDVIARAFGHPLYGSQDIVIMSMVILVFGGMALCDRRGGHVSVDLLERFFPPRLNRGINIAAALLGAVIFAWLAKAIADVVLLNMRFGISSQTNLLRLPINWFRWAAVVLAATTALGMFLRAVELTFTGRDVQREGASD